MGDLLRASVANGSKFSEPYKATKLWLEAVAIFRRGVPLGKHRKQWKTYENCFVAQEAISWYQSQLQVAFDPAITRKQTWTLLQKFYKVGVIAEVTRGQPGNSPEINETDFKDNANLYKLVCPTTPGSTQRKTERSRVEKTATPKKESPKVTTHNQYDIVIKPLTQDQIHCIWEQAFIDKFVNVVGCDVFTSFFTPGIIKGFVISYNLSNTGLHNIVLPTSKEEDLPHWLVSAMKCLSNWPHNHTQENGVPSYPGFENDVYKLISDYFLQFQNKSPLLTYALYDAFITCFIRAELFDFNSRLYSAKMANASRSRLFQQPQPALIKTVSFATQSPMFKMEDQYPFNASESVEDLILDILTPSTQRNRKWKPDSMGLNPRKNLFSSNQNPNDVVISDKSLREVNHSFMNDSTTAGVPKPMSTNNYDVNRYTLPLYYETAFTGNETPITRVVSRTELKASLGKKSNSVLKVRVPAASADAILDGNAYAYENPNLELSGSDLINHPKYSKILQSAELERIGSPNVTSSFWNYPSSTVERVKTRSTKSSSPPFNSYVSSSLLDDKFTGKPLRAYSAVNLTDASKMRDRQMLSSTLPVSGYKSPSPWTPVRNSLAVHYANSPSKSVRRMLEFYYGADACVPGLMTSDGKRLAIISFRLLTLLLPPANRRHLQILLRFMAKTSKNDKLMLDVAASTRAVIINTFFRTILKAEDPEEYDELLALRIATFLMDNDQEIFAVSEDDDIKTNAQGKVTQQQVIKVPTEVTLSRSKSSPSLHLGNLSPTNSSEQDGSPLSDNYVYVEANKENSTQFCSRISMNEYDDQRLLSGTSKSLRDLLDSWINDEKLDEREKRKQILKFKNEYPHIFWEKFGEEVPSFLDESKAKPKKEKKSWNVFKALRI